ncbi:MAG: hypothetical protein M1476_00880 [Candidatus Thermoplasmatota archaeon]|nr:hypothetical protein [Candidatus Thermoplasmatota archaeon]
MNISIMRFLTDVTMDIKKEKLSLYFHDPYDFLKPLKRPDKLGLNNIVISVRENFHSVQAKFGFQIFFSMMSASV